LGFEPQNGLPDATPAMDAPPAMIQWVKAFAEPRPLGTGPVDTFMANAQQRGNAVVLLVACAGSTVPTAVSVSAAGWSFAPLGPITGTAGEWAASFGAIAPDVEPTLFTVSWTGSDCDGARAELGDEFTNTDPAGGTVTFDMHTEAAGSGTAMAIVTTGNTDEAVWGACVSSGTLTDVGAGYTKGADNSTGDWSEYRITADAAGTREQVMFRNASVNAYVLTTVTIKPR
jgi:hypothetical protein